MNGADPREGGGRFAARPIRATPRRRVRAGTERLAAGWPDREGIRPRAPARAAAAVRAGKGASSGGTVFDADSASTYLFEDCRFEEMGVGFDRKVASPPEGVPFVGCTVVPTPEGRPRESKPRPLTDFNPDWK